MRSRLFIYSLALMVVVSFLLLSAMQETYAVHDVIAGFVLALVNGLLAAAINHLTLGKDHRTFMIWNIGGNGCRAGLLLLAIVASPLFGITNTMAFSIVTFAGYFSFMFFEIAMLHQQTQSTSQTA